MDELPSAQFRRTYAKLRKPTVVTVNGHPIGLWTPGVPWKLVTEGIARVVPDEDVIDYGLGTFAQQTTAATRLAERKPGTTMIERYDTRPIRPVPKKGR